MGQTNSIIAIKGNHLDKLTQIFKTFNYVDNKNDKQFDTFDLAAAYLFDNYVHYANKDIAIRGVWVDSGWTVICDPEMVDSTDDFAIEELSKIILTDIMTFLIQSTSGTFGFAKYNQTKLRQFYSVDSHVTENFGEPLAEENGLNINYKIFIDDIISLANKLTIDIEAKTVDSITVKELGQLNSVRN